MSTAALAPPPAAGRLRANGRMPFGFGRGFLLLLGAGCAWMLPAMLDHRFLFALLAWDLLLLAAWLADYRRMPRPDAIEVERQWPGVPSLLNPGAVEVRLWNPSGMRLEFSLNDDLPPRFRANDAAVAAIAEARDVAEAVVPLLPKERGDKQLCHIYVKYTTALRFAERWARAELPQSVRIYPDLKSARESTIYLTRTRRMEMQQRLLRQRGMGREFESLREYRQGDEFRDICWTASARRGKLVTKLHQMERSQAVWVVLDCGRLVRARVGELTKLDYLVNSALTISQLALQSGDRVGLIGYGRKIQSRVPLGRGSAHLRVLLDSLAQVKTEAPEADHLRAVAALKGLQHRRSLIVWLTDLAETAMVPEVVEAAGILSRQHLLLFVTCGQPELEQMAWAHPKTADEMYRGVAAQELVQRREVLLGRLRERGALTLEASPAGLSAALLNRYLQIKEQSLL